MANRNRLLYLLQFLQNGSDEDQPVSTARIREVLRKQGCPVTVETLRSDIAALREAGYDIVVNEQSGLPTTYSYVDRPFDVSELRILIDAVSSSLFIPEGRSKKLIARLAALAGPTQRERIQPAFLTAGKLKARNGQLLYIVERLREAVEADRAVAFRYYRYDLDKNRVPRREGREYVVSPYGAVWKNDRYFLIGWSEIHGQATVFRIDRMGMPRLLDRPRVPAPEGFSLGYYAEKVFGMYDDGDEETVTLRCRRRAMDAVVDAFGMEAEPYDITEETFDVDVQVSVSIPFFAWVFGFTGDMAIVGPEKVRQAYREALMRGMGEGPKANTQR